MSKKKDSKPTVGHKGAAPPSSTMVSVRFSEEELAQVKQAAKDRPLAAFIRRSALHASVEAINADHGNNRKTIQEMAEAVANRIKGVGDLLEITYRGNGSDGDEVVSTTYADHYSTDHIYGDHVIVRAPSEAKVTQLIAIIENATHAFSEALINALDEDEIDPGFQAAVKKAAE